MENNLPFLIAALGVTGLGIIAYLLFLSSRLSALRRELESLERQHDWPTSEDDQIDDRSEEASTEPAKIGRASANR